LNETDNKSKDDAISTSISKSVIERVLHMLTVQLSRSRVACFQSKCATSRSQLRITVKRLSIPSLVYTCG
jgi:hypothetical protein